MRVAGIVLIVLGAIVTFGGLGEADQTRSLIIGAVLIVLGGALLGIAEGLDL